MRTFQINYRTGEAEVHQQDEEQFTVHLPEKTLHLHLRQDNEGANHWFEAETDNETPETRSIGASIENYLAKENG